MPHYSIKSFCQSNQIEINMIVILKYIDTEIQIVFSCCQLPQHLGRLADQARATEPGKYKFLSFHCFRSCTKPGLKLKDDPEEFVD